MIYTVKRIDEDLDFGCEERSEDMPVMAIVTLINSSREEVIVKVEDAILYERNINEGDKVCFGVNNGLMTTENAENGCLGTICPQAIMMSVFFYSLING